MARDHASTLEADRVIAVVHQAMVGLTQRRSHIDTPNAYHDRDHHPWTQDFIVELARAVTDQIQPSHSGAIHEIATMGWETSRLISKTSVRFAKDAPYPAAWRVYAPDDGRLYAQPLIAECQWHGGWAKLSRACDRLAQGRAVVRLIATQADPDQSVSTMTLSQACAYRIAAFAPSGETVMLAFYSPEGAWMQDVGFRLFRYVTGSRRLDQIT